MNPLDMTGPEFLRFYFVYGLCGIALAGLLRFFWSRAVAADAELRWTPGYYPQGDEAYGIALLRGGRREAVRTLLGKLLATEFIAVEPGQIRTTAKTQDLFSLNPLERQGLQSLAPQQTPAGAEIAIENQTGPALAEIEQDLKRQGLVPPMAARNRLLGLCALFLLAIPGLGVAKLLVAFSRGRMNIGFLLIFLTVYTLATLLLLVPPQRTAAGRRYLAWLRDSHQGLRNLLANGHRHDAGETTMAAGIFGVGALPAVAYMTLALPPRRKDDGSSDGGSAGCGGSGDSGGGGSSCSGGDGGGGGCGGGGCGGCGGS